MLNYCISNQRRQEITVLATMMLAAVAALVAATTAYAQGSEPVSLYVTVTQGDKLIGGLREENFRLYEDGQSREFRLAEPEQPISIALLVEYSRNSSLYFDDIQAAVQGFVKEAPEGNWYALATFSKDMEIQADFTKLAGRITEGFAEPGGPLWNEVNTFDAVYEMLDTLGRLPGRRVLIVVGSGLDTFSEHTLDRIQKKIQSTSSNVTVYAVGAGSLLRGSYEPYLSVSARMSLLQAQSFMRMLADESGGEAWFPNFEAAYPGVMRGVMQDIAFQYRLVYVPQIPQDGKFHKIKVEAFQIINDKRQNFKVSARKGWRF